MLFLRKWLRNDVNNINEHSFIDGVLDVDYVCCKVVYSNNIWSETHFYLNVTLLYALKITNVVEIHSSCNRAKDFYTLEPMANLVRGRTRDLAVPGSIPGVTRPSVKALGKL